VGNPVASRHKWRIGHESVATQPTFLQLVRQELSNFALIFFLQLNQFVPLFECNGSCN
jgi:hypothetical protein